MGVIIIGGNGQLGMDIAAAFAEEEIVSITHAELNVEDPEAVNAILRPMKPELVINTSAYHKVDDCEKNPERSFQVNAVGPLNLARVCESTGAALMHISTDYVFDGLKKAPYTEEDLPNPLNVYAASKLAGEHLVRANCTRHYVVRSSGLYGHHPCRAKGGRNFIDTMLKLAGERDEVRVVNDEILTPTYTMHLAEQLRVLASSGSYGLYHATNNGLCSWYEFALEIFRLAGVTVKVVPVSTKEFFSPVKRPSYSVLDKAGLRKLGIDRMPLWRESLAEYFKGRVKG